MTERYMVGSFAEPGPLLSAVATLRRAGVTIHDVFAPYPVHGLDEAMGIRRSRLPWITLLAGLTGLCFALAFQYYTAVFDWPLDVGGKPENSTLAFVPIAFEMTILCAGLATAAAFLACNGLFPGAPARLAGPRVTNDRFAIALRWRSTAFDTGEATRLLIESGAIEITEQEVSL